MFRKSAPVLAPESAPESAPGSQKWKIRYITVEPRAQNTRELRFPKNRNGLEHTLPSAQSPPVSPPVLPPVLTLSPPVVLQMMNDHMDLFGAQSRAKCVDCGMFIFDEGLISLCFLCENKHRNGRRLRESTIDNGTLPPPADAPLLPGVARDPKMDKQIRRIRRMLDSDDDDYEPDFDDTRDFLEEAAKNPPPGAIPVMRDAGLLPPLLNAMPQVEPIDDIDDPLPMPGSVPYAPTIEMEGPAIQTGQQALPVMREYQELPQYESLPERKPLPEYEPVERKRKKTDMKQNYLDGYRPLKSRMTGELIQDEDGNDRKKYLIVGSHKRGVEDLPALAMITAYGETFADISREFKEMIKADGQAQAKKCDGAIQKYPGYLRVLFDNSTFFNKRCDLFKEGADQEADRVIRAEAVKRSLRCSTPYKKYVTDLNHGYWDFKNLVSKREALRK